MPLYVKNWAGFQHYKDRKPPWIKLHSTLLDNYDYAALTDAAGKALPLIWIVASENDGAVPRAEELAFRLRSELASIESVISELEAFQFLVSADAPEQQPNDWASRYISTALRALVWKRDGGKCRECKSRDHIEFDHVVPISRGGKSEEPNIQLLCRSCNRRKRNKLTAAEQLATNERSDSLQRESSLRSLEGEREVEAEAKKSKKRIRPSPSAPDPWNNEFADDFKAQYGGYPGKPLFKHVKAVVEKLGWGATRPVLREIMAATGLEYLNLPKVLAVRVQAAANGHTAKPPDQIKREAAQAAELAQREAELNAQAERDARRGM